MFISDQGILLKKSVSGEHFFLLVFFLRENGLKQCLARLPRGKSSDLSIPDLFQSGNVVMEQKDAGRPAYLKDFILVSGHEGIARSYRALKAASELVRFYERNLLHLEHYGEAWRILERSLGSMAGKPVPEAALLKAYFLFARQEGYPVIENWLNHKRPTERKVLTEVLRQPLEAIDVDAKRLREWLQDICVFFRDETDLLPPDL